MSRFDLDGATAVVTGGSRGIGPYIAAALAERGTRVALVARSALELEATARRLDPAGGRVLAITADITSSEDRHAMLDTVETELGPVDVLVNNAGGDPQRQFHHLSGHDIEAVVDLNLASALILARLVLPGMLARQHGHIINVSSMAGRTSFPHTEAYAAAKDGLIGFTRVLRGDYRRRGVSASTLILGPVRDAGVGARTAEEVGANVARTISVTPQQVGKATVRAIIKDKPELVLLPGPGRTMRAVLDRFPAIGPATTRLGGADTTMLAVADHREREARLAKAEPTAQHTSH